MVGKAKVFGGLVLGAAWTSVVGIVKARTAIEKGTQECMMIVYRRRYEYGIWQSLMSAFFPIENGDMLVVSMKDGGLSSQEA